MKRWLMLTGIVTMVAGGPASAQSTGNSASGAPRTRSQATIRDVPAEHWAAMAVLSLLRSGILTGYPDATFGGNRAVTRYEFAVGLQRLAEQAQQRLDAEFRRPPGPDDSGLGAPPGPQGPPGPPGSPTPAEVEQLTRDLEALKQIFTELLDRATGLRRDVHQLRQQLNNAGPARR